jgi:hypothetical protein
VGEPFHRGASLVDNDRVVLARRLEEVEDDEIGSDDEEMEDENLVIDGEETWFVPQS